MNDKRVALFIVVCYIVGCLLHASILKKTVYGDGIYYFAWIRSVVIDHDINFANEYRHFGVSEPITPTALIANKHSIGPALLWIPSYLWTHVVLRSDGYTLPYQIAVGLSSVFYVLIGLLLLHHLLLKSFGKMVSLAAIIATAFATNLFFYGSLDCVNSHAVSFFAATLFLAVLFQKRKNWFMIGVSLGLMTSIRAQDLLYGLLLVPVFIRRPPAEQRDALRTFALFFLGFFLAFSPQPIAWQILYGKFWANPYINSYEGFNFLHPHIFGVLFSIQNGLLLWTPIVILGLVGLIKRPIMLLVFALELYIVSSWSIWWQGASYSGRMFVSTLPLIAIGIAQIFQILRKRRFTYRHFLYIFVLPLSSINVCLMTYFLLSR